MGKTLGRNPARLKGGKIMYVNPFWYGVVATLFAEMAAMFIASVIIIWRTKK